MLNLINKFKNKFKNMDKNYLIIILVGLLLMVPLISYFYVNGHDTQFHLSNITILKNYLSESGFNLFKLKIIGTSAKNFGYGIGIFYPRIAHSLIAYLSYFTGGIVTSAKLYQFIVTVLSGFFMYKFIKRVTNNRNSALIGTVFYMCSPYFMSEFYVRSAMAECLNFIFLPMIFLGIYDYLYLNNRKNFYIFFIIGFIGVVNSHLITGVFLAFFVLMFLLFNIKRMLNKRVILDFILASIIVLIYCSPFLILMIQHKLCGNIAVFLKDYMGNAGWAYGTALNISDYLSFTFNSKNNGITFYLNIVMLIMVFYSMINYKKIINKLKTKVILNFIILSFIAIVLSTKIVPWYKLPDVFLLIQFPWRIEIFVVFFLSVLASFVVVTWDNNKVSIFKPIVICASIFIALSSIDYTRINYFDYNEISRDSMGSQMEYLPVATINNIDYFQERTEDVIIKSGSADINILSNFVPKMEFDVEIKSESVTLELPRLYYFGYRIMQNTSDGLRKIEYKENDNGFIEIDLKSSGKVTIEYVGTKLYRLCSILKIFTIMLIGIYIIIKSIKKRRDKIMQFLIKIKKNLLSEKNIDFVKKHQYKIMFILGVIIVFPFLEPHFALDSYALMGDSYINYAKVFIKAVRVISALVYCLFQFVHLPYNTASVMSTIFSIFILTLSIKELISIINYKDIDKQKYLLVLILVFSIVYNFMNIELFIFMEAAVMFLGILFCLKSLKNLLIKTKKNKIISLLYLILAIFCYQGVLSIYVPLVLFFILTDDKNLKQKIITIILSIVNYGVSFIASLLVIKLSTFILNTTEAKINGINIFDNINKIPSLIKEVFTTFFGLYSVKLFYLFVLILVICLVCLKPKKNILNLILIIVSCIVFAFIPNLFMSSTSNYTAPRMVISIGMIIPLIILYIILNYNIDKTKVIKYIVVTISILNFMYVNVNYFKNYSLGIKTFARDKKYVTSLVECIEDYENENNIKIKNIYYGKDISVNYHYDDSNINGFNYRIQAIEWAFPGLLNSSLNGNYKLIEMTEQETIKEFGKVNYDDFDLNQLKFENDTVYILLY